MLIATLFLPEIQLIWLRKRKEHSAKVIKSQKRRMQNDQEKKDLKTEAEKKREEIIREDLEDMSYVFTNLLSRHSLERFEIETADYCERQRQRRARKIARLS
jgi:hypothetical protein